MGQPARPRACSVLCLIGRHKRLGFEPWRRKWQPTPVFLFGKFHGQRSLEGYSPRGHKELNMTEHTCMEKPRHSSIFAFADAGKWKVQKIHPQETEAQQAKKETEWKVVEKVTLRYLFFFSAGCICMTKGRLDFCCLSALRADWYLGSLPSGSRIQALLWLPNSGKPTPTTL